MQAAQRSRSRSPPYYQAQDFNQTRRSPSPPYQQYQGQVPYKAQLSPYPPHQASQALYHAQTSPSPPDKIAQPPPEYRARRSRSPSPPYQGKQNFNQQGGQWQAELAYPQGTQAQQQPYYQEELAEQQQYYDNSQGSKWQYDAHPQYNYQGQPQSLQYDQRKDIEPQYHGQGQAQGQHENLIQPPRYQMQYQVQGHGTQQNYQNRAQQPRYEGDNTPIEYQGQAQGQQQQEKFQSQAQSYHGQAQAQHINHPPNNEAYSNPKTIFFHILFKVSALIFYVFSGWFTSSFVLQFVIVVLLSAFDFWTVKNVSGRILVGLRYWNESDEQGNSVWRFESLDPDSLARLNKKDTMLFWTTLYGMPAIWALFGIVATLKFSFDYLMIVIIALIMCTTNIIGFTKCRKDSRRQVQSFAQRAMGGMMQEAVTSNLSKVFNGFSS